MRLPVFVLLLLILILPRTAFGDTASATEPPIVRTLESASGEVTGISGKFINLLYSRTDDAEFEMYLPMDERVELEHYRNLSDVKPGDQVELQFEKVVEAPGLPEERMTRTVKKIRFVKRARQDELSSEEQ